SARAEPPRNPRTSGAAVAEGVSLAARELLHGAASAAARRASWLSPCRRRAIARGRAARALVAAPVRSWGVAGGFCGVLRGDVCGPAPARAASAGHLVRDL